MQGCAMWDDDKQSNGQSAFHKLLPIAFTTRAFTVLIGKQGEGIITKSKGLNVTLQAAYFTFCVMLHDFAH